MGVMNASDAIETGSDVQNISYGKQKLRRDDEVAGWYDTEKRLRFNTDWAIIFIKVGGAGRGSHLLPSWLSKKI